MERSQPAAFATICSSTLGDVIETISFPATSKGPSRSVVASDDRTLRDRGFIERPGPFPSSGLAKAPDFRTPARVTEEDDPARTMADDLSDIAEWND